MRRREFLLGIAAASGAPRALGAVPRAGTPVLGRPPRARSSAARGDPGAGAVTTGGSGGQPAPAARQRPRSGADPQAGTPSQEPLSIGTGPQLFLDDYLVERMEGLVREVQHPERLPQPVLDSATFGTTQPYLTVLPDQRHRGGFRLWYNRGPALWHAESSDGIEWKSPRVAWDLARSYGASLVDSGEAGPRRFRLASWQATRALEDGPNDDGGMYVGFSPDGLRWEAGEKNPVLPTWPEGWPKIVRHGVGDIVDVYRDGLRGGYRVAVKLHALPEDGYAPAPKAGRVFRRLVGMSTSRDFVRWEKPWRIFAPDARDEGLLEFYGMGAVHQRGPLTIGMVRVLRDDLPCDPGGPVEGIGYSVLATTRDGVHWSRCREPFLDRNPRPGSWDHAMSWISGVLPVGEEVYFYYGGYARGHKIAPERERQIGLARMRRDRYVGLAARTAWPWGRLLTRLFTVPGGGLTLNADARGGAIRARLLDAEGRPYPGFGWQEDGGVEKDGLAMPVRWRRDLVALQGRPARLELRMRQATLFAIQFEG